MKISKLKVQLNKEQRNINKTVISEEKIEDIFAMLSKIEPKNLMLSELLIFLIEKGLIKNEEKIYTFSSMYDEIKNEPTEDALNLGKGKSEEEEKFNK